jgi:hypothetical protein
MSSLRNQRLQRKSRVQRRAIVKQLRSKVQQLQLRRSRQQRRFLGLDKLWGWIGMSSASPAQEVEAAQLDTVDVAITAAETAAAAANEAEIAVENGDREAAVEAAETANKAAVLSEEAAGKAEELGEPDSPVAVEAAETANNAGDVAAAAVESINNETVEANTNETENKNGGNRSRKLRRQRRSRVQQRGGRAVSLNSALRLLRNYYARR